MPSVLRGDYGSLRYVQGLSVSSSQAYVEPDGHDNQCHSRRGEHP